MHIEYTSIGEIHSPYTQLEGMPIQPAGAAGVAGSVHIHSRFRSGLQDLDGFSHLILLYHFHRSQGYSLQVVPFLDTVSRGLFATRAPKRPNPIGLSVVRLTGVDMESGILSIADVDVLDGTPLLDIKPYVPAFNPHTEVRTGWLESVGDQAGRRASDDRFT